MSYFLAPQGRGRGLATGALNAVCRWVFANLEVERIQLYTYPDNVRSQRVAERAGFQPMKEPLANHDATNSVWFELQKEPF